MWLHLVVEVQPKQIKRPRRVLTIKGKGGLIAVGQVNGCPVKFLIDTGAVVTLVSGEMFQQIPNKLILNLQHTQFVGQTENI